MQSDAASEASSSLRFDFPGLRIGIAEYPEGPTGVTVFQFPHRNASYQAGRLSRNIDAYGVVPIAQVKNLAVTCAGQFVKGSSSKICGVHGATVAGPRKGAAIEDAHRRQVQRGQADA